MLELSTRHAAALEACTACSTRRGFPRSTPPSPTRWCASASRSASIEVGSGHSTRVLAKALGGLGEILAIDPAPRADIAGLPGVRVVPSTVQAAPARAVRPARVAGDVLFIDSSHILMPGSDVDLLLNRVLPRLPSGVLVHIHDIFLPFDYPPIWGWRAYNEQQGVLPLLATGAYAPLFSSVWASQRLGERLAPRWWRACRCRRRRCRPACGSRSSRKSQKMHGGCLPCPFPIRSLCTLRAWSGGLSERHRG